MQPIESPVAAVTRVLAHHGIKDPSNMLLMMLIDAVRDTTPPPQQVTINMLSKILHSLDPVNALDAWAYRSATQIVRIISQRPEVKAAAKAIDSEHIWCELEGILTGMLIRVCTGKDLHEPEATT